MLEPGRPSTVSTMVKVVDIRRRFRTHSTVFNAVQLAGDAGSKRLGKLDLGATRPQIDPTSE